ncbi:RNA polymerase sigma factor [Ideonella sp.]|uniref:RNA polymerase sigma factor n=1 Tax=Ideonella sp. TaxID=1929293 RepID=UPI002B47120B|nr:RNA polymerase sigma factor [Ideonella sp.]HJV68143.1 RNA polymerase sigma factor [Ideonella sp.]
MEPPRDPRAPLSAAARRDEDIVALLAAGGAELAFERLAARYAAKVYRLCLAMLREPARAEDAAQDSLLRAWRALGSYQPKAGALSTWLYAITRNRCLTLLERAGPPAASIDDDAVLGEVAALAAPAGPDADGHALLRRLVDALPDPQRLAMTLYYYEERAVAEAAAMLGLPEATVKTHLHRGRAALRGRLGELGLADPALWV